MNELVMHANKAKNILMGTVALFVRNHKFLKMESAKNPHAQKVLIGIKCSSSASAIILVSM